MENLGMMKQVAALKLLINLLMYNYTHMHVHSHTSQNSYARPLIYAHTILAAPPTKMREDKKWMKEMELEEKQRREDRQHQLQMMQILGQMIQSSPYPPQSYAFDYD